MDVPVTTLQRNLRDRSSSQTVASDRPINNTSRSSGLLVSVRVCMCAWCLCGKDRMPLTPVRQTQKPIITSTLDKTQAIE